MKMTLLKHFSLITLCCLFLLSGCKKRSVEATKWLLAGPDKELVEALEKQAKKDSANRTPEEIEAKKKEQEMLAQVAKEREAEIERLRAEGVETNNNELASNKKWQMPYNLGLVIAALMIAGFAFLFWWTVIRKIRNNIRDLSYSQNQVRNKFNNVVTDQRFDDMTDAEKEAVEKMKAFLNRNDKC